MLFLFLLGFHQVSHADYKSGFGDISINRLDWDRGTEQKSTKKDFTYGEIEGGAQYSWGELYGFFDYENLGKTGNDVRTATKGALDYYSGFGRLNLYAQVYNFAAAGFSEQNRVLGFSYSFGNSLWWVKPFLGFHDVTQTYFNGTNGYMGGWTAGYSFTLWNQMFLLADWHEYEFARRRAYAAGNGQKTSSHNGAASVWWNLPRQVSLGLQWRYATDKLGTGGSLNAAIYSLKYFF